MLALDYQSFAGYDGQGSVAMQLIEKKINQIQL